MKIILMFFFLLILQSANSQTNLVPNWNFEDTISCPQIQGSTFISYTPPWFSPNEGTPDIYNSCASVNNGGVPYNWLGYQLARTGQGYGGFARESESAAEYLSVKLLSPLKAGKKYCVSFYVNPGNYTYYVIDAIGAYISIDSIYIANYSVLPYTPQIENPLGHIISDTVNWTEISGTYIAAGGEQFITIGSFFPDSIIQTALNDTIHPPGSWPYYFLDDVSVYDCTDTTGINEIGGNNYFNFYPNPATDKITIEASKKSEIEILTVSGQLIKNVKADEVNETIDVSGFARGIYFVKVKTGKGIEVKKLILL